MNLHARTECAAGTLEDALAAGDYGLRRREAWGLDLADLRHNPQARQFGQYGAVFVRWGKSSNGSPPKRRAINEAFEEAHDAAGLDAVLDLHCLRQGLHHAPHRVRLSGAVRAGPGRPFLCEHDRDLHGCVGRVSESPARCYSAGATGTLAGAPAARQADPPRSADQALRALVRAPPRSPGRCPPDLHRGSADFTRARVLAALDLLSWLDQHGQGLRDLTQADLDRWLTDGTTTRRAVRYFLQ